MNPYHCQYVITLHKANTGILELMYSHLRFLFF
jgi:hypothetical protein